MEIKDFLAPLQVIVDLRASDKDRLLDELAHRAAATLDIPPDEISSALLKREELGSTGMGNGVAVPHARLSRLSKPFAMLARLSRPIDFKAIDGKPVDIVCLLLLPGNSGNGQLSALACAARALRNPEVLRNLRRAGGSAEAYRALVWTSGDSRTA